MGNSQKLIIDGYNVVFTDERLRRIACKDRQRAREELISLLRDYVKNRATQITLVFDGRGGIVDVDVIEPGRLQVAYSASGQTADELILQTLRESSQPRSYIVVTSDMSDIGRPAKALGCQVIGSKKFLERLAAESAAQSNAASEVEKPHADDAEYWLRKFTESDGIDDAKE